MLYKNFPAKLVKKQIMQGFTLAEVLITLVIIGVIAALTVPSLIHNSNKQETLTGIKKAYSVLQQSLFKINENNGYSAGDYTYLADDTSTFIDEFTKVVSTAKKGDNFDNYECLNSDGDYKYSGNGYKYIITADGIKYAAMKRHNMTIYGLSEEDQANALVVIIADINGEKKPNKYGDDTFFFYLVNKKGIVPAGSSFSTDCQRGDRGFSCGGKFLRENAVIYDPYQQRVE